MSETDTHIIDLVRHGETTAGNKRLIGRSDVPLSEHGWQQLHAMLQVLPMMDGTLTVCSSPLLRCEQFARVFARQHKARLVIEEDFREMDFGAWEMAPVQGLHKDSRFRRFFEAPHAYAPPDGEPFEVFFQRLVRGWQRLTGQTATGHTVLFTHGGVIRVLCCFLLQLPPASASRIYMPHAGHMRVGWQNGRATILSLNGYPCTD